MTFFHKKQKVKIFDAFELSSVLAWQTQRDGIPCELYRH